MTEPKTARRMSEKTRERLECSLAAQRGLLLSYADDIRHNSESKSVGWLMSAADATADCARDLARIANRLAKAGAQ